MCVFSWNRWSCGHFVKTRIEYCKHARDLPPKQRECNVRCEKPGDCPDLNNHIKTKCQGCTYGAELPSGGASLRYISLRTRDAAPSPGGNQPHSGCEQTYQEIRRELLATRCEIQRQQARSLDEAWRAVTGLTHSLCDAEDKYRKFGSKYYSDYWFGYAEIQHRRPRFYDTIVDAFHGNNHQRPFLQPWRDLEASIQAALDSLSLGDASQAYSSCFIGFNIAKSVYASLHRLECAIRDINFYVNLSSHINGAYREVSDFSSRDAAL